MGDRHMTRRSFVRTGLAVGTGALAGCAGPVAERETPDSDYTATPTETTAPTTDQDGGETEYAIETVGSDFTHPWALAFLPDDNGLLVTERPGKLRHLDPATGTTTAITGTPAVYSSGQGGLLDVLIKPEDGKPWVYLTYAATNHRGASATHLGRGRFDPETNHIDDFEKLHVAEPFVSSDAHYGSRVVIGPDEKLYVTAGDRQFKDFGPDHVAQDPGNELGTTLRLELDGTIPADNPFIDDPNMRDAIFSYGHRNAQGMTVHPETGAIWQAEHGERDGDEINVIEAGGNYGWPLASYACHYGTDDPVGDRPDERSEFVEPVFYWPCGSGGFPPSGMTFYDGDAFPSWQGDLFVGTLAGEYLGRFTVDGHTVTEAEPILDDRNWRIRAVEVAPDTGSIFVAVDAGSAPIVRIAPATN